MDSSILEELYKKYSKEKVDAAMALLSYRNVKELPKNEDPDYPILYVFRHGQSVDNSNFIFSGWRDSDLTEKGVEQAKLLSEKLKDKKIDILFSSDQTRAIKTIKIAMEKNQMSKFLELRLDPRLRERSYGDLQGTSKLIMQLENPELLMKYRRGYYDVPPNGESLDMVVQRVKEFINQLVDYMKSRKMNAAVVCSSNSIRGFRQVFEDLTDEQTALVETPLAQDYAAYIIK